MWRLWHCHGSGQNIVSPALPVLSLPLCNSSFHVVSVREPAECSQVTVKQSSWLFAFVLKVFVRGDMLLFYLDIRNSFSTTRKANSNTTFSLARMPKWSKFLTTCRLETCNVFFILSSEIQGGLFSSFVQQPNFQTRKLLPFYTSVGSYCDLFTQRVKKKWFKSTNQCFYFEEKQTFFFPHERQGKKRNHSKQMFCDSQLLALHSCGGYYPIICGFSCIILSVYFRGVVLFIFALIILELAQHIVCLRAPVQIRPNLVNLHTHFA